MLAAYLDILLMLMAVAIGVVWIYNLITWDGQGCNVGDDCDSCPFPCDKQNKTIMEDYEK